LREISLLLGDCLEVLKGLPDCSVDACVTDPPYGLSFMGKAWDHSVPSVEVWREVLRVLKPGAHLLAFFGARTYHRGVVAIEDAGFEVRDQIGWAFGSGFPKSHDVSKAIDREAGAQREVVGVIPDRWTGKGNSLNFSTDRAQAEVVVTGSPATQEAQQWQGWGTALKPAWEPIVVARKPFAGTVAGNVLEWGTGAINVDGCRVGTELLPSAKAGQAQVGTFERGVMVTPERVGRWPANLIHDGGDEVVGLFPVTGPAKKGVRDPNGTMGYHGGAAGLPGVLSGHNDAGGSAARFFYQAKASKADREDGLGDRDAVRVADRVADDGPGGDNPRNRTNKPRVNHHPTVKPTDLMRYLCRLVTPPGGVVLDPFMGSGSTGRGAVIEGFGFTGIEIDPEYLSIARDRIEAARPKEEQLTLFPDA
jgi:DNA modification methylase